MGLIPDGHMILHTKLCLDDAALKLSQAMETDPSKQGYSLAGLAFDNLCRFSGEVNREGFRIRRRNWFERIWWSVSGTFKAQSDGVEIHVKMSLHPFVKVFAAIWYAMIIYLLIGSALIWIRSSVIDDGVLAGLGLGAFFYVLTLFSWAREKQKAQRFLRALYQW
jgi:hypothetical protein